tara:strand:- start:5071 stop:5259 length:189 start_codon:yes stop_codon:yes gene_type:complete
MKEGTLVQHPSRGKAFVTEILEANAFEPIRVRWLNAYTHVTGKKVTTSVIWQHEITIISEGE